MFNSLKIKIYSKLLRFRSKPKVLLPTGFVNPYAGKGKINPYSTDYGEKKPKSIGEMISEKFPKKIVVDVVVNTEPSILHDMKDVYFSDILFLASKMVRIKKKERVMSADEIRKVCEEIKW